jgi:AmiR/NasT family two-component response regulator
MLDSRDWDAGDDWTGASAGIEATRAEDAIIFITAQSDEAIRSQVFRPGATECLFKPFSDTDLLDALNTALLRCCLLFFPFLFMVESGV